MEHVNKKVVILWQCHSLVTAEDKLYKILTTQALGQVNMYRLYNVQSCSHNFTKKSSEEHKIKRTQNIWINFRNDWPKDYCWCLADRRPVVLTPWPAPVTTCHLVLHSTHTPPLPCPKIHNINWDLASQPVISPSNSGWNAPLMFPPPVQITDICPPDSSNSRVSFTFLLDDDL